MSNVRLVYAAIIRDGETRSGFRSHADIRREFGDKDPYTSKRSDDEGFMTSEDKFVSRWEAAAIAFKAGQARTAEVELLSSEVMWDAKPQVEQKPKRKLYGKQPKRLFRG